MKRQSTPVQNGVELATIILTLIYFGALLKLASSGPVYDGSGSALWFGVLAAFWPIFPVWSFIWAMIFGMSGTLRNSSLGVLFCSGLGGPLLTFLFLSLVK